LRNFIEESQMDKKAQIQSR